MGHCDQSTGQVPPVSRRLCAFPPMSDLRRQYTRLAPLYDGAVAFLDRGRTRAIAEIAIQNGERVVIPGVGTGEDLPYLPTNVRIRGVDLTPAMLERARAKSAFLADVELIEGDATALPFPDASFDVALLHLILAVVPDARAALAEAARVVRPGGRASVFDKFVPPGRSESAVPTGGSAGAGHRDRRGHAVRGGRRPRARVARRE